MFAFDLTMILLQFQFLIGLTRIYFIKFLFILVFLFMGARPRCYHSANKRKWPPKLSHSTFTIDPLPIIDKRPMLDYKQLLQDYLATHSKPLAKVKHRKNTTQVKAALRCPWCNAPHDYIYINNGGKGQFLCKVCHNTFFQSTKSRTITYRCPFCSHVLQPVKIRKSFVIFKCCHKACPYRRKNLKKLSRTQKQLLKTHPHLFKLAYIFREPTFNLFPARSNSTIQPTVDLARIHQPLSVVGLVLFYYVNLGQSARETQYALKGLYNISISHQTILNYIESAAFRLTTLTDKLTVHISSDFVTDETYIRISGQWGYVIFTYVPKQNIITTQHLCLKRDAEAAWTVLLQNLQQIDPQLLEDPIINLLFVSDGSPIYKLAHQFAQQNGFNLQHKTVIGLKNLDPESTEFRVFKQFIERLNRTYKEKYRKTCGFKSMQGAIVFTNLFVIWFNYLRPHSAISGQIPNQLAELDKIIFEPAKWLKLLEKAQN